MQKHFFGRLAVLFILAASILVVSTYYVFYWGVSDKDNILDMHDAYYHYKFVESWGDLSDTTHIREELNNLHLVGRIYSVSRRNRMLNVDSLLTVDDLCQRGWMQNNEKTLTSWTNTVQQFSLCDYTSYQWSDNLSKIHNVPFDGYVSFGEIEINSVFHPATIIETGRYQVLLITVDYVYINEWVSFAPVVILLFVFMSFLYFLLRHFLRPITLMQNRIYSLEKGDLDSEIVIIGEDELALLSKNFNKLIKEIKNLLNQKERLLADVSHEIRTPLAKMRLLSEIDSPSEKMARINKQIDVLDSIVTNILISDKLAAPYSNLKIKEVSINHLLQQGLELSKNKKVDIISKGPCLVRCDVVKLAIVVKNLLDNAEKYASPDCTVKITYIQNNGLITINFQDSGPGIAENLLKEILQPYVRGENLKKAGFGLGLSICKRIMRAHGGIIGVQNNAKAGATFTMQWNSDMVGKNKDAKK